MRRFKIVSMSILLLLGCTKSTEILLGDWEVRNSFYKAEYAVAEFDNVIKAKLVSYDDGTTTYVFKEGTTPHYLLKNIQAHDHYYVDAVSGATKTSLNDQAVTIKLRSKDTLEITQPLFNSSTKELWVRKRNNK